MRSCAKGAGKYRFHPRPGCPPAVGFALFPDDEFSSFFLIDTNNGKVLYTGAEGLETVVSHAGFGVYFTYRGNEDIVLVDVASQAPLHTLLPESGQEQLGWASNACFSPNGLLLALAVLNSSHSEHDVHVFDLRASMDLPAGPLPASFTLRLATSSGLLEGRWSIKCVVPCSHDAIFVLAARTIRLRQHFVASRWSVAGAASRLMCTSQACTAEDARYFAGSDLIATAAVACTDKLFVSNGSPSITALSTASLAECPMLSAPPLRGGHASCITNLASCGCVLLSLDMAGVLLAWDVTTHTLLRRLGRDVLGVPRAMKLHTRKMRQRSRSRQLAVFSSRVATDASRRPAGLTGLKRMRMRNDMHPLLEWFLGMMFYRTLPHSAFFLLSSTSTCVTIYDNTCVEL